MSKPETPNGTTRLVSVHDIASGKYAIDMTGGSKWGERVTKLRTILKLAAPKANTEPAYTFGPYYFCRDGYWFRSSHAAGMDKVDVFQVNANLPPDRKEDA